jgi:hypothetical protein
VDVLILTNSGLGYSLGDFFTNSSGHPGYRRLPDLGRRWSYTLYRVTGLGEFSPIGRLFTLDSLYIGVARVARWFVFKQKIPIWVNFGVPYVDWKRLIYFMTICNISWTFGIFKDHTVHFVFIWYIFSDFGIMYQEKSGNPGSSANCLPTCFLQYEL